MPENGKEILEAVLKIQQITSKIQEDVSLIKQKTESIEGTVGKHEELLYGDSRNMGKGGLIATVTDNENAIKDVRKQIDGIRGTFAVVWTGLITLLNLAIDFFFRNRTS